MAAIQTKRIGLYKDGRLLYQTEDLQQAQQKAWHGVLPNVYGPYIEARNVNGTIIDLHNATD